MLPHAAIGLQPWQPLFKLHSTATRCPHACHLPPAVLMLAHGKEWREALRVAYGHSRPDLVDTLVAPQAAQTAAAALEGESAGVGWWAGDWVGTNPLNVPCWA